MLWSPKQINKFCHKSHPSLFPCTIKWQLNGFHPQALPFHQKILSLVDCLTSIPCLLEALKALVFRIGNLGLAILDLPPEALLPYGPSLTLILSITVIMLTSHLLIHHRDITVGSHLAVNIPRLCSKCSFI